MSEFFGALLFSLFSLALVGPVLVGFLVSLSIVGKGLRLAWAAVSILAFIVLCGLFVVGARFISSPDVQSMLGFAIPYSSAALLVPLAHLFRRWRLKSSACEIEGI